MSKMSLKALTHTSVTSLAEEPRLVPKQEEMVENKDYEHKKYL